MRLDKYLAHCGLGTRSDVKKMIQQGRVRINEHVCKIAKTIVHDTDAMQLDGENIVYERYHYIMMNKMDGVLSTTKDGQTKTVIDCLDDADKWPGLFPVGRLDKDTTGFILLTNNGALAHAMLHPKKHVKKRYEAKVVPALTKEAVEQFQQGIVLENGDRCLPAVLTLGENNGFFQEVSIEIEEGKFHQIKRMVLACGSEVRRLHRTMIGPLSIDETLDFGEYRYLSDEEIAKLEAHAK